MQMKRMVTASVAVVGAVCCLLRPVAAPAQIPAQFHNDKIVVDYYEPRDPNLETLYTKLKGRQVLEELSQFLAPVQWPRTLRILAKQCPDPQYAVPQVSYSRIEYSLTVCYQFVSILAQINPPPAVASQQQVLVGGLVGILLQQAARAVFDMFDIPLLGYQDDASDQLMAFTALQFNNDVTQALIRGTYYVWQVYDDSVAAQAARSGDTARYDWSSPLTLPRQRMYNILCIAYGQPSSPFKALVDQGNLLSTRAPNCAAEYQQAQDAFTKTVAPHVNADLMKLAPSINWVTADDLK